MKHILNLNCLYWIHHCVSISFWNNSPAFSEGKNLFPWAWAKRWRSLPVHSPTFRPSAAIALEFPPSFIQSHFSSFCSHKKTWHTCIDKLLPEANDLNRNWNRTRQKKNCFIMFYSCTWLMMYGLQLYDDWKKRNLSCLLGFSLLFVLVGF